MQTQIIRRICDNPLCGLKEDFNGQNLRPEDEAKLASWIMLTKEHSIGGQIQPLAKHGCCGSCAVEILRQGLLELPVGQPGLN
jgi:hypothetical protein